MSGVEWSKFEMGGGMCGYKYLHFSHSLQIGFWRNWFTENVPILYKSCRICGFIFVNQFGKVERIHICILQLQICFIGIKSANYGNFKLAKFGQNVM